MAAIAERAGFTKPALYAAFAGKAALAAALGGEVAAELRTSIVAGLASSPTPEAGLRLAIDAFFRFAETETALFRFLVQGAAGFGRAFYERQLPAEVGDAMTALIAAGLRRSGADPSTAPAWGYAVMGAVFMAADWWVDTRAVTRDDLVDHLTSLLWNGMGRTAGGQPATAGGWHPPGAGNGGRPDSPARGAGR